MPEDRVYEVHGTLRFMQCQRRDCASGVWPTDDEEIAGMSVDEGTSRVTSGVPKCPTCSTTARPNVLMFGDWDYRHDREDVQSENYRQWRAKVDEEAKSLVVLEIGAGKAVPTVRHESRTVNRWTDAPVIRINPEEPQADKIPNCIPIVSLFLPFLHFEATFPSQTRPFSLSTNFFLCSVYVRLLLGLSTFMGRGADLTCRMQPLGCGEALAGIQQYMK